MNKLTFYTINTISTVVAIIQSLHNQQAVSNLVTNIEQAELSQKTQKPKTSLKFSSGRDCNLISIQRSLLQTGSHHPSQ
jgi:hypothetical protein